MLVDRHHQGKFVLISNIDNVPAGATGQLKKLDSYHVALLFDEHDDLVFDIHDTDEAVWAAINPSMTDPPRFQCQWKLIAASVIAFTVGWLSLPQPELMRHLEANIISSTATAFSSSKRRNIGHDTDRQRPLRSQTHERSNPSWV